MIWFILVGSFGALGVYFYRRLGGNADADDAPPPLAPRAAIVDAPSQVPVPAALGAGARRAAAAANSVLRGGAPQHPLPMGERFQCTLLAHSLEGERCAAGGAAVDARVIDPEGEMARCAIRDQRDGTYMISFTPSSSGAHELHVTVDKREIVGSPFGLHVSAPLPDTASADSESVSNLTAAIAKADVDANANAANANAANADAANVDVDADVDVDVDADADADADADVAVVATASGSSSSSSEVAEIAEPASSHGNAPSNAPSNATPSLSAASSAASAAKVVESVESDDEDDVERFLFGDESESDGEHQVSVQARRYIDNASASGLAKLADETAERDIDAEESDDDANEDYDIVVLSESARFRVGFAETQGPRPTMEDAMVVYGKFRENDDEDMFGVFDGHGGDEASDLASDFLYEALESAMDELDGGDEAELLDEGERKPNQLANASTAEADELIAKALKTAFVKTHREIVSDERQIECGTTALVAYARGNRLHVANVGDSRCVVAYSDGRVERVTRDHKSTDELEMKAVSERGGFVVRGRVMGMIAIARALGDKSLADYLGHEPDVFARELDNIDLIILACDGIWDVLSDEEAVRIARSTRNPRKMAERLRNTAIDRQSRDNVSVLCIATKNASRANDD